MTGWIQDGPQFQKKNSNSWDHGFSHDDQNYFLKKTGKPNSQD